MIGAPRYYVFHLVRHSRVVFEATPEEEARVQAQVNEFILSWAPKVRLLVGAHAMGMTAEWDWLGVFGVDELSDWEAMREEYRRRFPGRTERNLSLAGVSHDEFVHATADVEHYRVLRSLGGYPGGAESPWERPGEARE